MRSHSTLTPTRPAPALLTFLTLLATAAALLPGTAVPAAAEPLTLTLDLEESVVRFTLGATLHTVRGSFRIESGELTFDPATGEVSGRVVMDATSGNTGNRKRDRDMHVKVLESEQYPDVVFLATRFEGVFQPAGESEVTLHGTVRIHGSEHEIAIPATVEVETTDDGGRRLKATGTFVVPYVEWGMENPSKFLLRVDKTVEVTIQAEGRIKR